MKNRKNSRKYDSLKDVLEFQKNMYNPGHYIGTGRIPPTVSAPGNAVPLIVLYIFLAVVFAVLGLFLFFSNVIVTTGLSDSRLVNKTIALITMLVISAICLFMAFAYLRKVRRYKRQKSVMEIEPIDEEIMDKIAQRTCPECGEVHDIDYPKCPKCKFNYMT